MFHLVCTDHVDIVLPLILQNIYLHLLFVVCLMSTTTVEIHYVGLMCSQLACFTHEICCCVVVVFHQQPCDGAPLSVVIVKVSVAKGRRRRGLSSEYVLAF